jgi:hypothetical protein
MEGEFRAAMQNRSRGMPLLRKSIEVTIVELVEGRGRSRISAVEGWGYRSLVAEA